jgi:hypothetical protein
LGISINILAEKAPPSAGYGMFPITRKIVIKSPPESIDNDGMVTIYVRSWRNRGRKYLHASLSAIVWLLREPEVCHKILTGEIHDAFSLSKSILALAVKRAKGEDASYFPADVYGSPTTSKKDLEKYIENLQRDPMNGDGFDYLGTMYTALYFLGIGSKLLSYKGMGYNNGPITYMRSGVTESQMKSLVKSIDEGESIKFLQETLRKSSGFYDTDRFFLAIELKG